jgi:hypothetical protein
VQQPAGATAAWHRLHFAPAPGTLQSSVLLDDSLTWGRMDTHMLKAALCVLLVHLACWCCSIDYPVKWFVVVVGEQAAGGKNAIAYEVKHLLEYPQDKVGEWVRTTQCVLSVWAACGAETRPPVCGVSQGLSRGRRVHGPLPHCGPELCRVLTASLVSAAAPRLVGCRHCHHHL